jgi:hypothetical protein
VSLLTRDCGRWQDERGKLWANTGTETLKKEDTFNEDRLESGAWWACRTEKVATSCPIAQAQSSVSLQIIAIGFGQLECITYIQVRDLQRLDLLFHILSLLDSFHDRFLISKTSLTGKGIVQAWLKIVIT